MNQLTSTAFVESPDTYQVVIRGIRTDLPQDEVRNKLATLFKVGAEQIERLLAVKGHAVKKGCTLDVANKYKNVIEAHGAVCELVLESKPVQCLEVDLPELSKVTAPGPESVAVPVGRVAAVEDAPIPSQEVHAAWRHKFMLIDKAGGPKYPSIKELSGSERRKIIFNGWALLFGPIYYASKGMGKKGLSLAAVGLAIAYIVEQLISSFGISGAAATGFIAPAIFATRANIDYYKKMVCNDNGWW